MCAGGGGGGRGRVGKGVLWFMYTSYVGEEGSPKAYACVQVERGNPKARVELRTYLIEDPS